MKIAAIVCEYNPFHNGHKYQIEQTRAAGATHIVAIMSGSFVQRGDIAIFDKYTRARTALENGVDLVVELPTRYALSAAETFAAGAVGIAEALGCVDMLSFGSESGDIAALKEASAASEYAVHTELFDRHMRSGKSFPAALAVAVKEYYTDDVYETLSSPNNVLAVEYLNSLDNMGSKIQPFTVKRLGAHDSDEPPKDGAFAGASAIRRIIRSGGSYGEYAPEVTAPIADIRRLERAILAKLRSMTRDDFERLYDGANGLCDRLGKAVRSARSLDELYFLTKTKRYTLSRIRRAVLCGFLGLYKDTLNVPLSYIRVLGMNANGRDILSAAECALPIDTSLKALSNTSPAARKQAYAEAHFGDLYALAFEEALPCGSEFSAKPVII